MIEISEPTCSKCRWHKDALKPDGTRLGVRLDRGWYEGGGNHYDSLGAVYCEHIKQPRGLVLTNYVCPNFERPPDVSMVEALSYQRDALSQQAPE